ncbi:hypothetical protein FQZ97_923620 [compost metagenome]
MGITNLCRQRRVGDIAVQGQGRAQADGVAIDLGNDRLLAIQHREDDLLAPAHTVEEALRLVDNLLHLLDVATGAERPTGARKDDDLGIGIMACIDENPSQLSIHLVINGIECVRTIEGNGQNAIFTLELERLVAGEIHRSSSYSRPIRSLLSALRDSDL